MCRRSCCAAAISAAPAPILVISRSQNQADELFRKLSHFYRVLGEPVPTVEDNAHTLSLENNSRIVCLPHSPATIVGYSGPSLIIIDEAARVSDETYLSSVADAAQESRASWWR